MKPLLSLALAAVLSVALLAAPARASTATEAQGLVDQAKITLDLFADDPNMDWLRENFDRAKAVLIIPRSIKGGFIFGASGGEGVLMVRGDGPLGWSYPAFYRLGSVTFGLQAGAEVSEILLMVMTQAGIDALLTSDLKLGADVSIAAGPVGVGAKAQTTDVLAFGRSKGLYGGLNVEGALVKVNNRYNEAYYGRDNIRPRDIIVTKTVSARGAEPLRMTIGGFGQ